MAQPPPYNRSTNFADYQAVNPNKPLPGGPLDEEFARVKQSLDGVLQNLKLIQRDDTALANKSVGYDQLKDELDGFGFNPPTEWAPETNYVTRDTVFYEFGFYRCVESHISSSDFSEDSDKWDLVADFAAATTEARQYRDEARSAKEDAEAAQSAAETARDAAAASASSAGTSASAAATSESNAAGSASAAASSAGSASTSATEAANSASAAASSAAGAEEAKDAAEAAQSAAEDAADRAEYAATVIENPVSYAPQTLTPAEQGQARANIGVGNTFNTVAALLADDTMSYTSGEGHIEVGPGDIIEAQGFRYEVAASDATDAHVETAGGVKLYVRPDMDILDLAALGFPTSDPDENNSIFSLGCRISKRLWFSDTGDAIPIKTIRIDRDLSLYSDGGTLDGIITNLSSNGDVLATGLKVRMRGVYFKPTAAGVGSSPWHFVIHLKHFDFFSHKDGGIDGGGYYFDHDNVPSGSGVWEPHELQNGRIFITGNEHTGDAAYNENPEAQRRVVFARGYKYLKIADNDVRVTNIYEVFKTTTSALETHIKDNFVEASVGEEIWDAFSTRGPLWCSGNHWIAKMVITTDGPVGGVAVITKPHGLSEDNRVIRGPFYVNFTDNVFETDGGQIANLQGHYSIDAYPDGSYPTQVLIWKDNRVKATCRVNGGAALVIRGYSDVSVDGGVISYGGDFNVMWGLHFAGCKKIDVSGTRITRGSVAFATGADTTGQPYGSNEIASVSKVTLEDARFDGAFHFNGNPSLIATIDDCDMTVKHTQSAQTRPWHVTGALARLKVTDCRFTIEPGASGGPSPAGRSLVTDLVEKRNTWTPDKGGTASRPIGTPAAGTVYFDTDVGKPIWWDGSTWVDAAGAEV